jgi:hypothetical protein
MTTQKQKLLKAKIAAALYHEEGRVPTKEEIEKWTKFAKVLYTAVLGLHFERSVQKKNADSPGFSGKTSTYGILCVALRPRVVYQRKSRAELPSTCEGSCPPLNPMECEKKWPGQARPRVTVETGDLPACPEFVRACSTASVCD